MKTAFRYGIATKRLADAYNARVFGTSQIMRKASVAMTFDSGEQTTHSGSGHLFENFMRNGVLEGFTGRGMTPVKYSDPNAEAAILRTMTFSETYIGMTYKITRSKLIF